MKNRIITTILTLSLLIIPVISYADQATDTEQESQAVEEVVEKENLKMSLSLEEAIEIAIENSQEIELNLLDIEVKKVEETEARYREKKYDRLPFSLGTVEGFLLDENMMSTQANYALEEEMLKTDYIKKDLEFRVTNSY